MGNVCNIVARSRRDAQSFRPLDTRPGMRLGSRASPPTAPACERRQRCRRGGGTGTRLRYVTANAPTTGAAGVSASDPGRRPVGSLAEQGRYATAPPGRRLDRAFAGCRCQSTDDAAAIVRRHIAKNRIHAPHTQNSATSIPLELRCVSSRRNAWLRSLSYDTGASSRQSSSRRTRPLVFRPRRPAARAPRRGGTAPLRLPRRGARWRGRVGREQRPPGGPRSRRRTRAAQRRAGAPPGRR